MFDLQKYNIVVRKFDYQGKDLDYRKARELYEEDFKNRQTTAYQLRGIFINHKSQYGDHPVLVTTDYYVDLARWELENCERMLEDSSLIDAINRGEIYFVPTSFKMRQNGKECYTVKYITEDKLTNEVRR